MLMGSARPSAPHSSASMDPFGGQARCTVCIGRADRFRTRAFRCVGMLRRGRSCRLRGWTARFLSSWGETCHTVEMWAF